MNEEFIHFIWKFRLFNTLELNSINGYLLEVIQPGQHNQNAGPDFNESKVKIKNRLWVGDVEIHIKSSDWIKHKHHRDPSYGHVILHVVWENDRDIYIHHPGDLPVLEVKKYVDIELIDRYKAIAQSKSEFACKLNNKSVETMIWNSWLDRLLVERLERKQSEIQSLFEHLSNNLEHTAFVLLAKNFGFRVNANAFQSLAESLPKDILFRHRDSLFQLEALLFGQAGLLQFDFTDDYPLLLYNEYEFLKRKYSLTPMSQGCWRYLRMMPTGFPSTRISQFAHFIHLGSGKFFSEIYSLNSVDELMSLFEIEASSYWTDHSKFDRLCKPVRKKMGKSSQNNILINTVIPMLFFYGRIMSRVDLVDKAIAFLHECMPEKNAISKEFVKRGFEVKSAGESQALIELKNSYCSKKKCLNCVIGLKLIR